MRSRNQPAGMLPGVLLLALAIALFGCGTRNQTDDTSGKNPNIVIILIDALRADHLGCYGYDRDTSPAIDELSRTGLLFENAISQAPWTAPSVSSIFTSKYPFQLGVGASEGPQGYRHPKEFSFRPLGDNALTLAEILKTDGYVTISVVSTFVAEKNNLLQGFDHNDSLSKDERAESVVDAAIEGLKHSIPSEAESGRPFLLYLHFMDVHEPTEPPPPFDTMYPTLDSGPHTESDKKWPFADGEVIGGKEFHIRKSHKVALYDGAIRYVDSQIGRLLQYLKGNSLHDNTVFVILSDHGNEFWERANFEKQHYFSPIKMYGVAHGSTVFNELLHIPIIICGRGVPGGRISQQVRAIDVTPTLLGMTTARYNPEGLEGIDLVEAIKNGSLHDMTAFSEEVAYGYEKKSIQDGRFQLIRGVEGEVLIDKTKPSPDDILPEGKDMEVRNRLGSEMSAILSKPRIKSGGGAVVLDEDAREKLKALGYLN